MVEAAVLGLAVLCRLVVGLLTLVLGRDVELSSCGRDGYDVVAEV